MHNSRHFTGQTGRQHSMAVLLLLLTLLLGGVSLARAQTGGTNAGSAASSTAPMTDEQRASALKDPEVAGYVVGRVLALLLCPAAVIFVLYKAFGKKGGTNSGPTNTLTKP